MKMVFAKLVIFGAFLFSAVGVANAQSLSALYESACSSNGIDTGPRCNCIKDTVVRAYGEDAARYVAADMNLLYDEAETLRNQVGEETAFAASDLFDIAQHGECSSGRLARREGTFQNAGGSGITAESVSSDAVAAETAPVSTFQSIDVMTAPFGVIDLREIEGTVITDVSAVLTDEILNSGTNIRNHVAFYQVVDTQGGIDTNGDGSADLHPGDENYSSEVQKRSLPTKLYIAKNAGREQVLGDVHFEGGALYAPYVRIQTERSGINPLASGGATGLGGLRGLLNNFQTPMHLHFIFPDANPNHAKHFAHQGKNRLGFKSQPDSSAANEDYQDAVFLFESGI